MQRWLTFILIGWFALLGSGAVQYVHSMSHREHETAAHVADSSHHHCSLCDALAEPITSNPVATHDVTLHAMLERITQSMRSQAEASPPQRIACRGPPSVA
jgi:hypothetical protein